MTDLRALYEAAESGTNLYVTGPHYEWMERLEHEKLPSRKALFHVVRTLLRQYKRPRRGRISPSAMGKCSRRVMFEYAQAPQSPPDANLIEMADHGTELHIKWQIEGITMGWLRDGEFWVEDKDLLIGGSLDGLCEDGSVFELKSAAPSVYQRIVNDQKAPKFENLMQFATYCLLTDADYGSIVYEDRAYGKFHEFRVSRNGRVEREVLRRLNSYKGYVEADELPDMLPMCEERIGSVYKQCPFRFVCPTYKSVSEAWDAGVQAEQADPGLTGEIPKWAMKMLGYLDREEAWGDGDEPGP